MHNLKNKSLSGPIHFIIYIYIYIYKVTQRNTSHICGACEFRQVVMIAPRWGGQI